MVTTLAIVLAFTVGWLLAGLLYARTDDDTIRVTLADHERRIAQCEAEQAGRDVLVADARTLITAAAKRIQTRFGPDRDPTTTNGSESPLSLRTRLRG